MRISEIDIENIKNQADIVDVLSRYVNIIAKGKSYVSLCPFHNDTNPSMHISPEKQIYKCFSCGEGGNVFSFVQAYDKLSYPESILKVAKMINYDLSKYESVDKLVKDEKKERLLDLLQNTADFYNFSLISEDGIEGFEYLKKRGIDEEIINKFKIGYAPSDSSKLLMFLTRKNYSTSEIIDSGIGLIKEGVFEDRFKGRVIFSISDNYGSVVGFSGRDITNKSSAKYINSSESKIFKKNQILYNFYQASKKEKEYNCLYLVEGFMDVIAFYKLGIENVIASMGTSLSNEHVKLITNNTNEIVLSFDNDEPGLLATLKAIEKFNNSNILINTTNPNTKFSDIDEMINKTSLEETKQFYNKKLSFEDFGYFYFLRNKNMKNYQDQQKFINDFFSFLKTNKVNDLKKQHYIDFISKNYNLSKEHLEKMIIKENVSVEIEKENKTIIKKTDRYYLAEVEILKQMLNNNEAIIYFRKNLKVLNNNQNHKAALYICQCYEENNCLFDLFSELEKKDKIIKEFLMKVNLNKNIPNEFNEKTFLIIKEQYPLNEQINKLEEQIKIEKDFINRLKLINQRQELIIKLNLLIKQQ